MHCIRHEGSRVPCRTHPPKAMAGRSLDFTLYCAAISPPEGCFVNVVPTTSSSEFFEPQQGGFRSAAPPSGTLEHPLSLILYPQNGNKLNLSVGGVVKTVVLFRTWLCAALPSPTNLVNTLQAQPSPARKSFCEDTTRSLRTKQSQPGGFCKSVGLDQSLSLTGLSETHSRSSGLQSRLDRTSTAPVSSVPAYVRELGRAFVAPPGAVLRSSVLRSPLFRSPALLSPVLCVATSRSVSTAAATQQNERATTPGQSLGRWFV